MAMSLAEIVILCLLADWLFRSARLPGFLGMLLVGALVGPQAFGLIDPSLGLIGADLRMIALVVILLRAGFELSPAALRKVGWNALLLSFLPGLCEAATVALVGPLFLPLTRMECAILGYVLAAVSPAVVVPRMIRLNRDSRGTAKGIPTMVLAGASVDDVVAIVAFGALLGLYTGSESGIAAKAVGIPISVVAGIVVGLGLGLVLIRVFDRFNPRATKRALVVLGVAILLVGVGTRLDAASVPFAPLLSVMAMGVVILDRREAMAHELSAKFGKIWIFAEILLFSLVGAQVDFRVALDSGLGGLAVIVLGLLGRSVGTVLSAFGRSLTAKEKLFVVISYLPKATVQAAIGSAPLAAMASLGMPTGPGKTILAVSVLAIVVTAPLGAFAIDWAGNALLSVDEGASGGDALGAVMASDALVDDEDRLS